MAKSKIDKSKGVILKYDIVHGVADLPASDGPDLDLRAINAELMTEFGFSDRLAHLNFLYDAAEIIRSFSDVTIQTNKVDVPADLTNFSEAKTKLNRIADKVDELAELIFAARRDALMDMLLKYLDADNAVRKFNLASIELMRVFAKVDELEGRTGKPITAKWVAAFCVHCQKFWKEQKGTGTRIMFNSERKTIITPWVEAVFMKLTRAMGMNDPISVLHGVARSIPAYQS